MRIAGYIDHPVLKITIFQMDNRFSVKLETPRHEQTYKFRKGGPVETVADVRAVVDETFIKGVLMEMKRMDDVQRRALQRMQQDKGRDEFPEII